MTRTALGIPTVRPVHGHGAIVLDQPFRQSAQEQLGNAQMRLRAGLQREVEQMSERIGLPTRSEMDAAHRRIAELERSLRRLQAQVAVLAGTAEVDPVAQPAPAKVSAVKARTGVHPCHRPRCSGCSEAGHQPE